MELVVMAGIFDINISEDGITDIIEKEKGATGCTNSMKNNLGQLLMPLATEGQTGGLGGSVLIMQFDNTTVAAIEGDAVITTGSGGRLEVTADSSITGIELAQSGAQGASGLCGTFSYINHDSLTLAQIETRAAVTGRRSRFPTDDTKHLAGSVMRGNAPSIGASWP
jgi:hypothetical protein